MTSTDRTSTLDVADGVHKLRGSRNEEKSVKPFMRMLRMVLERLLVVAVVGKRRMRMQNLLRRGMVSSAGVSRMMTMKLMGKIVGCVVFVLLTSVSMRVY